MISTFIRELPNGLEPLTNTLPWYKKQLSVYVMARQKLVMTIFNRKVIFNISQFL
ncbi:hypothetical protein [Virgibacillus pantothenticus]|uniref:hypothetical protein n=1 Tax=Virgibacillus pantothenticus TaxID=1473 RepID=UPI00147C6A1A|nr:hypothetical protein [Virgibacillus pantothenticus]